MRSGAEEILDGVGCGIWMFDGVRTFYVNRALEELTGYTREELLAEGTFARLLTPEAAQIVLERGKARLRGETVPAEYELSLIRKDGASIRIAVHARLVGPPLGPASLVSAINVTARYEAEQAIRQSEQYHRGVLDTAPAFVITTRPDGSSTFINQHWRDIVDVPPDATTPTASAQVIHPEDIGRAGRAWNTALKSGKGYDIDYRIRMKGGDFRWVSWRIRPIHSPDEHLLGWSGVGIDVHDARQTQVDLENALEQLRLANAVKDEFLGLVSHELRTPLTTIVGLAGFLTRNSDGASEAIRETYAQLSKDAQRLQSLVENLLVLARLDETSLEFEPVLPHHIVHEAVEAHRARFPSRRIVVTPATMPPVMTLESLFRLIVDNLLTNAEKYSPPSEVIDIECDCSGDMVTIAVADRGPGVLPEDQPRLFDPFFRSSSAVASRQPGAGLGLAVCKRLIELHNGSIAYEERPGGGSIFRISMPAMDIEDEDPAAVPAIPKS